MMSMSREKKSLINILISLMSQICTVLVGMLLPRALMINYGSETNGLITSLQQLIGYLTLIEGGLLSAVTVSLYKPLADEDQKRVNEILSSAKYFYRRVGCVFCGALLITAIIYPHTISQTQYTYVEIVAMVLLIGINGATQILFIGKYKALLMASQMNGLILAINAISTALYTGILIVASYININVVAGLTIAVGAYVLRAVVFFVVARRLFPQYTFKSAESLIIFPQRKDALLSQAFSMISLHGGVIVLTLFKAPMELMSVYTTYNLILSSLYMLMYSVENSVTAALGNLLVKESPEIIRCEYEKFDALYHLAWSVVIGCLATLLLPFVSVYTAGVKDIEYILPVESRLFVVICALWMLRNQQTLLMTARGNFKEMRKAIVIESMIVVVGGASFYWMWDLKGMLMAKVFATTYMVITLMHFSYKNILQVSVRTKMKRILLSAVSVASTAAISNRFFWVFEKNSLISWMIQATIVGIIGCLVTTAIWLVSEKPELEESMKVIRVLVKKRQRGCDEN